MDSLENPIKMICFMGLDVCCKILYIKDVVELTFLMCLNEEVQFMLKEFKEFALKGNVIDLAVGVIIGGAFGKIVTSLVNDIVMPVIGMLLGGVNFTELKYVITAANGDIPESAILYGAFIQSIVNFLVIAFSVFIAVKIISAKKKKETPAPAKPLPEVVLLEEIRDLLKEK